MKIKNDSNPSGFFLILNLGERRLIFSPPHGGIFIGNISSSDEL
jgi:hypothetical protein